MSYEPRLGDLVEQIKQASENIVEGDARVGEVDALIDRCYLQPKDRGDREALAV